MMEKSLANIIKEQLIGQYSGHMSAIPFNPVLHSMFTTIMSESDTLDKNKDLATALRKVADALEEA